MWYLAKVATGLQLRIVHDILGGGDREEEDASLHRPFEELSLCMAQEKALDRGHDALQQPPGNHAIPQGCPIEPGDGRIPPPLLLHPPDQIVDATAGPGSAGELKIDKPVLAGPGNPHK